ncbi:MAG TPA: TrkA family potassium uptake protein [Candidatus Merdivicinus faecavium]|nr:TrkA family potassium uptake protein [Candidatus Merdivicinus faecavium]
MNILIVGCGRVGSELAGALSREGHTVAIVDANESAFDLLPPDYSGYCTVGIPIDLDVLREAGIENCDALAAVSQDDNTNIMVCQLAKEYFHLENILARIYDPRRENVFSHFGLRTVCPTRLTVETVKNILLQDKPQQITVGPSTISFHELPVNRRLNGASTSDIDTGADEALFAVRHADNTLSLLANGPVTLRSGDTLIVSRIID